MAYFGKSFGGGRRSAGRSAVVEEAVVSTVSSSTAVAVVDISTTGAKLRGIEGAARGEELLVRVNGRLLFGTVRWVRGELCGVKFDPPMRSSQFEQIRRKQSGAYVTRGSAEQILAFDDWKSGFAR